MDNDWYIDISISYIIHEVLLESNNFKVFYKVKKSC